MKCKNCGSEVMISLYGLRSFCSEDCKKSYRKRYKAEKERLRRIVFKAVDSGDGYVTINSRDVDNINPPPEPVYRGKNRGHGLSEDKKIDHTEYGGTEWYELAKECCNFEVRKNEGYCVTLHEPYFRFRKKCSDCPLGRELKLRDCQKHVRNLNSRTLF